MGRLLAVEARADGPADLVARAHDDQRHRRAAEETSDRELRDLMDLHFFGPEALAKEVDRFGIRVLIVEPGAFRTSFNGPGALLISPSIAAYDEQIEPLRTGMPADDGKQPGDPAKAAAAILAALNSPEPPLRLVLGNDAVDAVSGALDAAKAELAAWERVGRATEFD